MQNHMLHVLASVVADPPDGSGMNSWLDAKYRVMAALRPLTPDDVVPERRCRLPPPRSRSASGRPRTTSLSLVTLRELDPQVDDCGLDRVLPGERDVYPVQGGPDQLRRLPSDPGASRVRMNRDDVAENRIHHAPVRRRVSCRSSSGRYAPPARSGTAV